MKKLFNFIQSKIDNLVIQRIAKIITVPLLMTIVPFMMISNAFQKLASFNHLRLLYQKRAINNFTIHHKIVNVKKGKRRYSLAVLETPDGKRIYNLGRHTARMVNVSS